jgi:hypothetical protein
MTETTSRFLSRQTEKLRAYALPGKALNLNTRTTYYSQRDNHVMPLRTCCSSSNAMYLDWLRQSTGRPPLGGDDAYLDKVLSFGDTIDHDVQTRALKAYGFSTEWIDVGDNLAVINANVELIDALISRGFPVVVNIAHRGAIDAPRGGHVILLCGYLPDSKEYLAQDPYGTLQSDYQDENGRLSRIKRLEFIARWQGGYRILA